MENDNRLRHHMKTFYRILARNRAKNFVIAILLLTTIFGAYQYDRARRLQNHLNNTYNRAFHELVDYVNNVEIKLLKTLMTSSPELTVATLRDVCQDAYNAANNLSRLPVSFGTLSNTEKFLSQVSDLSQSVAKQTARGVPMTDEQYNTFLSLHSYALELEKSLNDLKNDLNNGNFKWENVAREKEEDLGEASEHMPVTFSSLDENFSEMPTLIYDGPFSEHMLNRKALGLTGKEVTENQAIESIGRFLGKKNINNVTKVADNNNGVIDTYNFRIELANRKDHSVVEADVSKKGGHIIWYLYNRPVSEAKIGIDEAKNIGKKFLEDRGIANMKDTYYLESNGVATINYAYTKDGITYYTDLIKVKVALDNGEVVGYEAKGYYMNHTERNLGAPKISLEEARAKVIRGEDVKESGLALIPTNYGTEILCYEFIGKLQDKDFLIYINADTGAEEEVLLIINSEEGILTM
ncbi:MAG: germination protein YpeB [Clostridiaceae bacterium]|nr:germination protein YpeB [Clostridiaceae bacterium]